MLHTILWDWNGTLLDDVEVALAAYNAGMGNVSGWLESGDYSHDGETLHTIPYPETDAYVRILRRALRDIRDRGRTLESVITQYLTTVKPMHEQFVEPSRKYADIIVLEGGHNLVALDMIMQRIASHIASED